MLIGILLLEQIPERVNLREKALFWFAVWKFQSLTSFGFVVMRHIVAGGQVCAKLLICWPGSNSGQGYLEKKEARVSLCPSRALSQCLKTFHRGSL